MSLRVELSSLLLPIVGGAQRTRNSSEVASAVPSRLLEFQQSPGGERIAAPGSDVWTPTAARSALARLHRGQPATSSEPPRSRRARLSTICVPRTTSLPAASASELAATIAMTTAAWTSGTT